MFRSLAAVVEQFNNTETSMLKMEPMKAIQLESVEQPKHDFTEKDVKTLADRETSEASIK